MAAYVFDTSGLVKRHFREVGSAWVRGLMPSRAEHRIYISRITAVEVVAAMTRRQRGGGLSPAQGGAILGHFRRHLANRYRVLDVSPSILADAMLLARRHGLRGYDAVQLANAAEINRLRLGAARGPAILVSADRKLNAAAVAEGLAVESPEDHP